MEKSVLNDWPQHPFSTLEADLVLGEKSSSVYFLEGENAKSYLMEDSDMPFFAKLSPVEVHLRTNYPQSNSTTADSIAFVKKLICDEVVRWTKSEKKAILPVIRSVFESCNKIFSDLMPPALYFIKCKGISEGVALYTRGTAIVIPKFQLDAFFRASDSTDFQELLIHEVFHIFSRYHSAMRFKLYETIGFTPLVHPLVIGPYLQRMRITNPDCPEISHGIEIQIKTDKLTETKTMVLVDYANGEKWSKSNDVTSFLASKLFPVELEQNGETDELFWQVVGSSSTTLLPLGFDPLSPIEDVCDSSNRQRFSSSTRINPRNDLNFFELTGSNTFYINHPEEILADNVAILGMCLSGYDIDEVDENGIRVLGAIATVFGEETLDRFHASSRKSKKNSAAVSTRQKKRLMERNINEGKRARRNIGS